MIRHDVAAWLFCNARSRAVPFGVMVLAAFAKPPQNAHFSHAKG
jgi:hypothetical protein